MPAEDEVVIRSAQAEDGPALQEIELLAGAQFRDVGMGDIAAAEPSSLEVFARYAAGGRSWVATDRHGEAIGFTIVDVVDGAAHVEQVSVVPDRQGRGVGCALLDRVQAWAAETGRPVLTLTTFSEVPWNRPLYEHLGFRVLSGTEIGPELRAVCANEAAHGLDPATRVCMGRAVDG
jgi:GNAT superfamily N-acetyltransferase